MKMLAVLIPSPTGVKVTENVEFPEPGIGEIRLVSSITNSKAFVPDMLILEGVPLRSKSAVPVLEIRNTTGTESVLITASPKSKEPPLAMDVPLCEIFMSGGSIS